MGLIKAALGSFNGTMADMWKEFFYCDALDNNVLAVRGQHSSSKRSSNKRGHDNVISNGSGIVVADGQCMMIVDQGKIVEVCAEPGEYTYDNTQAPTIFSGGLGKGIIDTFKTIGKRFTFGGDTGVDQRVYYFNIKELVDNKFGTPNPIPFRVVDKNINLDIDVSLRCSGVYSYKIEDPILFYTNVCGNIEEDYTRDKLESQLKTEFISALQPAFAKLSAMGIRPSEVIAHNTDLEKSMDEILSEKWSKLRGLDIVSVAIGSVTLPDDDAERIKRAQNDAIYRDPLMAAATLSGAQADAMRAAAANEGGAMNGFMGMGMAMGAGGANTAALFEAGAKQQQAQQAQQQSAPAAGVWKCTSCGTENTGNFCTNCGTPKPVAVNKFCPNCGFDLSGSNAKFCPNCGNKLD